MKSPTVLICSGKDCRKKKSAGRYLLRELAEVASVSEVGCQKICDGPVLGIKINGAWEWFEKLRRGYDRAAIRKTIENETIHKTAKCKRVKSRSGKRR